MASPILLKQITDPAKAKALFADRRPAALAAHSDYYAGDHWQASKGWIGAAPTDGDASVLGQIKEAFVSENVIAEVIDRHVAGILGREPLWGFIPADTVAPATQARRSLFSKIFKRASTEPGSQPAAATSPASTEKTAQEADDALTQWWNQARPREQLKQALVIALAEGKATIRFFVPRGLRDQAGAVPLQKDLASALNLLHIDVVYADKGGVFLDANTQQPFGVYVYESNGESFAEVTWVERGQTFLQVLAEKEQGRTDPFPFDMQGRLWMYELRRKALITDQVTSNQKSLNLALTMMMRNINLAGSLERTILNAERPMEIVRIADTTDPRGYREEKRDMQLPIGAGATTFLNGVFIKNEQGQIIGRANPNISFRSPVAIDTFTGTHDQFYASILGQCQQKHALISGDASASGVSREQARGEYQGSLKDSKDPVDDAGRWILETPLRLAAQFCNQSKMFAGLRCDFNSIIETGPVSADERSANRDDVEAKLMSAETAMSRNGVDDTDAELERIRLETEAKGITEAKDFNQL